MTKKLNSFKNILSVLLALLLLGIAAGPASATLTISTISATSTIGNTNTSLNFTVLDDSNTTSSYNITLPEFVVNGATIDSNVGNLTNWTVTPGSSGTSIAFVNFSGNNISNFTSAGTTIFINISDVTIPTVTNTSDLSKTITVSTNSTSGTKTFARTISSVNSTTTTLANTSIWKVANNSDPFVLLLTAKDVYGNVVNGITFTGASNRTTSDAVTVLNATNLSGVAFVNVNSTLAGLAKITVTYGTESANSTNVVFVAGPAFKLAFFGPISAAGTTALTPGTSIQVIAVQDENGNNVTGGITPTLITLTKTNNATFSVPTLAITDSSISSNSTALGINTSGLVFTSSVVVNDTFVETTTIGASTNGTYDAISKDIHYFGPVTKLAVTLSKYTLYANSSDTLLATVQLQDAASNSITTSEISVTLTANNGSLFTIASPTNNTDANGVTTFTVTAKGLAGSTTLRAIDGSGNFGDSSTVTLNQAPSIGNSDVANNTDGVILTGANSTITATIEDYAGIVISGQAVTFNITTGDATFTDGSTLKTVSTASTGIATAAVTSTNASVLNLISVNVTILNEVGVKSQIGELQDFTVEPSAAYQFVISPSENIGIVNIPGTTKTINITVEDIAGNENNTADGIINITTSNTDIGNMSNGTTVINNLSVELTDGFATFTYTVNSSDEGTAVLTLNESSLGIVGTITIATTGAKGIVLTVDSSTSQIGIPVTAYAQLTDASGDELSISGTIISLTVKDANNELKNVSTNTSNASGIASFEVNQSNGGTYTLTASNATLALSSNPITVIFAGSAASIVVTKNISSPSVDQIVTINATIKDANGVTSGALDDETVTFLANDIMFGSATISDGIASITYTKATAGTVTIKAFYNDTLQGSTTVTFGTGPVLTNITIATTSTSVMVNGTKNFTAVAKDQTNTVMTGITYTWASSNNTVGTISSTGVFTALAAGTTSITASSDDVTSNLVTVNVTATNPLPDNVAAWDEDNSGTIEKSEAVAAVRDYLHGGGTSKADAVAVVRAYLHP